MLKTIDDIIAEAKTRIIACDNAISEQTDRPERVFAEVEKKTWEYLLRLIAEDIPADVVWVQDNQAFYRAKDTHSGDYDGSTFMGQDFLRKWWPRRAEFPQSTALRALQ